MRGYVLTPSWVVDRMVEKLFRNRTVSADVRVLDPGCGSGVFIDGVIRWCATRGLPLPSIVGVDSDPTHVAVTRRRFAHVQQVEIREADFLSATEERYDYIIGNPPYVPITALAATERADYRQRYATASGRFDLYLLFFEQALGLLKRRGRLVFITPEKYLYVATAAPLRLLLTSMEVNEFDFLDETTFGDLVTYPLVSTVTRRPGKGSTRVIRRNGKVDQVRLPGHSGSWLPSIMGAAEQRAGFTLGDICLRVSCGVATGADSVFVRKGADLEPQLKQFAHPTIAGRELKSGQPPLAGHIMLVPYDRYGNLIPERQLGELGRYLSTPAHRRKLLARTCVSRKPWYAFHETPPLRELLRPKILCKDIGESPFFLVDEQGTLLPRHSVYYIVPINSRHIVQLASYLNSEVARDWLYEHCQRASKGFLRLQSHVLKQLPVPESLGLTLQNELFSANEERQLSA